MPRVRRPLFRGDLHIFEQIGIVAGAQGLAAGGGYVAENHLFGFDVGELFHVGGVVVAGIEIAENGWSLVTLRMVGVVDAQVFDGDAFRHIAGVAEIMLSRVRTADQAGTDRPAVRGYKNAVANDEFALPGAAIVGAQVDKTPPVDPGILDDESPAPNGVNALVPQL